MTDISNTPGILTLDMTSTTGRLSFALHNQIPQQIMTLKRVRVQCTDAAQALATRIIYVDLPFTSSQHLIDNINARFYLPILLDNAIVTSYTCELPVYLSREVPDNFEMRVVDSNGALITGVTCILQFQFDYSHIS